MAVIGVELDQDELVLTKGRDFRWTFTNLDAAGAPTDFPTGSLYFEVYTSTTKTWNFTISGSSATIKIEHTEVDSVPNRTKWQLVFRPSGEAAGGDPIARGVVRIQE
jgi:hypothetical protein